MILRLDRVGVALPPPSDLDPAGAAAVQELPPQPAVFASDYAPEEIVEIAQKLRKAAGLPDEPTGVVSDGSAELLENLVDRVKS